MAQLVKGERIVTEVVIECISAEPNVVPHQVLEPGK